MGVYDYFNEIEKPVAEIFFGMSNRGICVDLGYLQRLKDDLEAQKAPVQAEIENELGPINLNSPKQLLKALNEKGINPIFKGKPSTDKRALQYQGDKNVIKNLLAYSQLDTLLASFVDPYLARNAAIVHPFFNQCGTRTGRPSCSNPNLLQIPKKSENGNRVRKMFIPRPQMALGDCDFGQIEPRVLAHFSKDEALCQMFHNGIDFHSYTSERLGITRDKAKVLNLSVGYRATRFSVMQQLKCSESEAQNEIDKWWALFPQLRRWQDRLVYDAKRSGFCTTLLGRRLKIDDLSAGNAWRREGAERQLINNITQGSAAEVMKMAMIKIHRYNSTSIGLLIQVYDELVFESDEIEDDLDTVVTCMENAVALDVPLVVDAKSGPNWGDVS